MLGLISILGFVIISLLLFLVYSYLTADATTVTERIQKYVQHESRKTGEESKSHRLVTLPESAGWRKNIRSLSGYFDSSRWAQNMERKLVQADLPLRGSEYVVICLSLMFFFMALFLLFSSGKLIMGIVGLCAGYLIPLLVVKSKTSSRIKAFDAQISDALVLISSSLRSGYSFMQAIELVSREMQPPISVEFFRVLREINLGVTTDEAMGHMAERVDSDDLDLVVTAVLIQRQVGGNLAEILDSISNTIRERVKIKGHIRTLTAQGRLSGLIIGLLPVVLVGVMSIINPDYISLLLTTTAGHVMLIVAAASEIFGMLVIRKIVNINV